jgi:hypothetical protein
MLNEIEYRSKTWKPGVRVRLLDGQRWHLLRPSVVVGGLPMVDGETARPTATWTAPSLSAPDARVFLENYGAAIRELVVAEDRLSRLTILLGMAFLSLQYQYSISWEQARHLVVPPAEAWPPYKLADDLMAALGTALFSDWDEINTVIEAGESVAVPATI